MSIRIDGIKTRVKYLGVFDFKQFYRDIRDQVQDKGYINENNWKYMEPYYSEKHSSDPREATTVWIWWRTSKKEEDNPFYTRHIDIEFHLRYLRDVEMMIDGQKRRLQKAEIELLFDAWVELDAGNKWEDHWLLKNFLDMFVRRIWRKRREAEKWGTVGDCMVIQTMVKDYFKIHKFVGPPKEPFYPAFGYKTA